jgi:hypothetical protein
MAQQLGRDIETVDGLRLVASALPVCPGAGGGLTQRPPVAVRWSQPQSGYSVRTASEYWSRRFRGTTSLRVIPRNQIML